MSTEHAVETSGSNRTWLTPTDPELPPMVHQDTPLKQFESEQLKSRYVFAVDELNRILGVVPTVEILQRLNSENEYERARWGDMPLSHLIGVKFPAEAGIYADNLGTLHNLKTTNDCEDPAVIATKNDVFLSWDRLSSIVAGAMSDPLTGLPTRTALERRVYEEWNRSKRTGCSIGVIFVDLDNFKETNDQFGHAAGDAVLCQIAERLEKSLRSYDLAVRYGGDEFIALCLGCSPDEIHIPITRFFENLNTPPIIFDENIMPNGASVGAVVRHSRFSEYTPKDLFAQADQCLYQAKNHRGIAVYADLGVVNTANDSVERDITRAIPSSAKVNLALRPA